MNFDISSPLGFGGTGMAVVLFVVAALFAVFVLRGFWDTVSDEPSPADEERDEPPVLP